MKKIIVYETSDGVIYRNEEDALRHERKLFTFDSLYSIDFYDIADNLYHAAPNDENFNERAYEFAEKVHIHNTAELIEFMHWAGEGGYCEFYDIDAPGFWVRKVSRLGDAHWEMREPRTEDSNPQAPENPGS